MTGEYAIYSPDNIFLILRCLHISIAAINFKDFKEVDRIVEISKPSVASNLMFTSVECFEVYLPLGVVERYINSKIRSLP